MYTCYVDWKFAKEIEVICENLPRYHFVNHKYHIILTGLEPWSRTGNPASDRLRYGTAIMSRLLWDN
jgi:hypothetical protein